MRLLVSRQDMIMFYVHVRDTLAQVEFQPPLDVAVMHSEMSESEVQGGKYCAFRAQREFERA